MSKKEKPVPLIVGDGQFGRPNDNKPFTGWTRVPATGHFNTPTSVMRYVHNGVITNPTFTSATDGTPFSMGGWDFYKKFWSIPVNIAKTGIKTVKNASKHIKPTIQGIADILEVRNEAELEADEFAISVAKDQITGGKTSFVNIPARLTPSGKEGLSVYDVNVANDELKDIRKRYGGQ